MNNQFDELTKSMAQAVTRRAALKKFSVGLASLALACLGLANKAEGHGCIPLWSNKRCKSTADCCSGVCCPPGKVYGSVCVPDISFCVTF